ncbi:MAG: glycosyltransferase [Verrucomicrobia bacterium]|nr:glycosyltransferase [Verrucomicrobiota bacterium]
MRILHLNNERTWRGGERQTLLLAAGLRDAGAGSILGCRPGGPLESRATEAGLPTRPIPGNNAGAALAIVRAARDVDLIHCHTGRGHSLAAATASWHRKPFLVTRRVDFLPGRGWFNRFKFVRAACVVCISQHIADQLADWGVARERLTVIRSTVPPPAADLLTAGHRDAVRARLGIAPGISLIGNIAALVGHKDHATLLRAAKVLLGRRRDARFVILGDGDLRGPLLALRRDLGLDNDVLMPGFVPRAEEWLPGFDVLAMSSCMEGLGSIVLDAFAAGVPVAATAGGGLPELVRDGETGLVAPVGDAPALAAAIDRLLDHALLARQLAAAARRWVQAECSVARMTARYQAVYDAILEA